MMLSGVGAERALALGLCGLAAGAAQSRRRWTAALALCGAELAVALATASPPTDALCGLAAALGVLAVPERALARLRGWLAGESRGACDPDRLAARLRAESGRKLRAMSDAFGEMSEGYRLPVDIPDEQSLLADLRARLCDGCPHYAECWAGEDNRAVRFLCQLVSEAIDWAAGDRAEPLFGDELPPELLRQCHRGRSIPARLGEPLEEFARKRRSEMKRSAVNQLISAQFMQAQMLLRGLADAQARTAAGARTAGGAGARGARPGGHRGGGRDGAARRAADGAGRGAQAGALVAGAGGAGFGAAQPRVRACLRAGRGRRRRGDALRAAVAPARDGGGQLPFATGGRAQRRQPPDPHARGRPAAADALRRHGQRRGGGARECPDAQAAGDGSCRRTCRARWRWRRSTN